MVQSQKQFEKVIERLVVAKAPSSIVVEDPETSLLVVIEQLLSEYGGYLKEAGFVPVIFDCTQYEDSLSMWAGMADSVRKGVGTVFQDTVASMRKWERLEKSRNNTESIKMNLVSALSYFQKQSKMCILFIMVGFEAAIDKMDDYDILKVRSLTNEMAILTVSRTALEDLGEAKYNNSYFSNQFLSFYFGNER